MIYDSESVGCDAVHDFIVYFVVFKRGNKSFNLLLWLILKPLIDIIGSIRSHTGDPTCRPPQISDNPTLDEIKR